MLSKKLTTVTLMLTATLLSLSGCSNDTVRANTPTTGPAISSPATPTSEATNGQPSSDTQATTEATATPTPTPTATPTPIPTVPPAPVAVNTDNTNTTFIINRDYPLSDNYKPSDLVAPNIPFSFSDKTLDKRKLKQVAATALEELYETALAESGLKIYGVSGYRSYERQYEIYATNLINKGTRHTNLYSAAPGNSEHQTGLAIDVSCESIGFNLDNRFASTAEGIWLKENCWRFGFILRYPKDKEEITGYAYEPWHIRYVGVPLAYYLYNNNMTLEEYYGSPASQSLASLEDKPLISLTTTKFYKLYAKVKGGELMYDSEGAVMVSTKTGYPFLTQTIKDSKGNSVKVNGKALYLEPIKDSKGNIMLDKKGEICYKKPYFDSAGNLWLNSNMQPVFLEPLWNANGTLAYNSKGELLYTEPVKDGNGSEFLLEDGSLLLKVPVRNHTNGELTYHANGTVIFYEPYIIESTGEIIRDTATNLPLFDSIYYEVPHNTLPVPAGSLPTPTPTPTPTPMPTETPTEIPTPTPTPLPTPTPILEDEDSSSIGNLSGGAIFDSTGDTTNEEN